MSPASNNEPAFVTDPDAAPESGDSEVAVLCEETPGKLRRDIVSGESIDASGLIRFVVSPDGDLVPDLAGKLPGRGMWVAATRAALEIAVKRNIFSKAAKRQIKADSNLPGLVHDLLRRRCLELLGLARREGALLLGFEKVLAAAQSGKVDWIVEAGDSAEDGRNRILGAAARQNPPAKLCGCFNNAELSLALGAENAIHAALIHGRRSQRWSAEMTRLSGFEPLAPADWRRGSPP